MAPTAVVTGCNSGIGHAFAELLIKEGYSVHAADLTVGDKLKSLKCKIYEVDVSSSDSIRIFATQLGSTTIDVLLNVAGVMSAPDQDSLSTVTPEILTRTFQINTFGPLLLTQALLPRILESSSPRIGIVSSRVGSMGDNSSGGSYAYRSSKAAVNSIGRSMAMDLREKGVVVSLLHPGYVHSGLQPAMQHPEAVQPDEAAGKLWKVMEAKTIEDTGRFWHREGQELPW